MATPQSPAFTTSIGHGVAIGPERMLINDDHHQLCGTRDTPSLIVIVGRVLPYSRVFVCKGITISD